MSCGLILLQGEIAYTKGTETEYRRKGTKKGIDLNELGSDSESSLGSVQPSEDPSSSFKKNKIRL